METTTTKKYKIPFKYTFYTNLFTPQTYELAKNGGNCTFKIAKNSEDYIVKMFIDIANFFKNEAYTFMAIKSLKIIQNGQTLYDTTGVQLAYSISMRQQKIWTDSNLKNNLIFELPTEGFNHTKYPIYVHVVLNQDELGSKTERNIEDFNIKLKVKFKKYVSDKYTPNQCISYYWKNSSIVPATLNKNIARFVFPNVNTQYVQFVINANSIKELSYIKKCRLMKNNKVLKEFDHWNDIFTMDRIFHNYHLPKNKCTTISFENWVKYGPNECYSLLDVTEKDTITIEMVIDSRVEQKNLKKLHAWAIVAAQNNITDYFEIN